MNCTAQKLESFTMWTCCGATILFGSQIDIAPESNLIFYEIEKIVLNLWTLIRHSADFLIVETWLVTQK
jgi:hypothetical protein